ncbi:hypothetical protein [Miltoncostaea marina]|uniref:hypothetical protein n=1 Tax=Miltoncostaea marina TaxID=2843215 RepID=UPI001C3E6FF1|nr:hypothetical protein [Miltoncostaea marina]
MNEELNPRTTPVPTTDPPVDDWERQGALRELTRVARDLQLEHHDAVVARLGRLTAGQRQAVAEAMERILEMGA